MNFSTDSLFTAQDNFANASVPDISVDPSPRPAKKPRGKKTNVTRACENCRRKRTKCDGRPRCSSCQLHDLECGYGPEKDGRRLASKQYVQALEHRVRQLEHQLERGIARRGEGLADELNLITDCESGSGEEDGEHGTEGNIGSRSAGANGETSRNGKEDSQTEGRTIGALKISGPGLVSHYGPSSAYMHLPDEAQQASLNDEDDEPVTSSTRSPYRLEEIDWTDLAWSRYLAPGAHVSATLHAHLLRVFFKHLNWWCHWCDESLFLRDLVHACETTHDIIPSSRPAPYRTLHYSPLLHNVILALALLNSPESLPPEHGDAKIVSSALASHALSMIEDEMLRPMTTTVRGIMLLGSYYFHNLHRNLGWNYAGMGARTAQLLGLNTDCQDLVDRHVMTMSTKHHRDQTFWTVYIQDSLWSFNVGRTPTFNEEDYKTALPLVREKDDEEPWLPEINHTLVPSLDGGALGRPAWRSSCLLWTAKLMKIGNEIHRSLYRVRQPASGAMTGLISKLEVDLEAWLVNLVPPLRTEAWQCDVMPPHILNMHAVFNYLRILLHRPACYDYVSAEAEARQVSLEACETAARQLVRLFEQSPFLRHSTTTLPNIAFTAGTTFLLVAARNDQPLDSVREALSKVDQCVNFLRQMSWPAAMVATEILQRLKAEWVPPGFDSNGGNAFSMPAMSGDGLGNPLDKNTIQALKDPDSDIAKLLKSMGWQPPNNLGTNLEAPQLPNAGPMLLPQGLLSQLPSRAPTPNQSIDRQLMNSGPANGFATKNNLDGSSTFNLASMGSLGEYDWGDWASLTSVFGESISHPLWDPLSTWPLGSYDSGASHPA